MAKKKLNKKAPPPIIDEDAPVNLDVVDKAEIAALEEAIQLYIDHPQNFKKDVSEFLEMWIYEWGVRLDHEIQLQLAKYGSLTVWSEEFSMNISVMDTRINIAKTKLLQMGGDKKVGSVKKIDKVSYANLADVCWSPDDAEKILSALKKVIPADIEDNGRYIGGKKGKAAIIACGDLAHTIGLLKETPRKVDFGKLLSSHFTGLSVVSRSFENAKTDTYKEYYKQLQGLFSSK